MHHCMWVGKWARFCNSILPKGELPGCSDGALIVIVKLSIELCVKRGECMSLLRPEDERAGNARVAVL